MLELIGLIILSLVVLYVGRIIERKLETKIIYRQPNAIERRKIALEEIKKIEAKKNNG